MIACAKSNNKKEEDSIKVRLRDVLLFLILRLAVKIP